MNVITSIACVFSSFLIYSDPAPGTVIVKTLDGKPAVGASVWVYPEPGYRLEPKEQPAVLKTDANGSVVALKEKELKLAMRVFVQDQSRCQCNTETRGRARWCKHTTPSRLYFEWDVRRYSIRDRARFLPAANNSRSFGRRRPRNSGEGQRSR